MRKDKLSLKTSILKEIFNIAPKRFQEKDLDIHPLAKKFHISGKELKDNIDFLVETGLIRRWVVHDKNRIYEWVITDKGLDYLEKKEAEKNNFALQTSIVLLTSVLALSSVSQIILIAYPKMIKLIGIVLIIIYFVIIAWFIKKVIR